MRACCPAGSGGTCRSEQVARFECAFGFWVGEFTTLSVRSLSHGRISANALLGRMPGGGVAALCGRDAHFWPPRAGPYGIKWVLDIFVKIKLCSATELIFSSFSYSYKYSLPTLNTVVSLLHQL